MWRATALLAFWHLTMASAGIAQPIQLGIDADFVAYANGVDIQVKSVIRGGVADQLGIVRRETIELIDGQPIASEAALFARLQAGPPIALSVRDANGQVRVLNIAAPAAAGRGGRMNASSEYRLTNEFLGTGRSLDTSRRGRLSMAVSNNSPSQLWLFNPVGGDRYRITNVSLGADWSLTAAAGSDFPSMEQTDPTSARQLWTLTPGHDDYIRILHESRRQTRALDNAADGDNDPVLAPRGDYTGQMWQLARQRNARRGSRFAGTWAEHRTANDRPSGIEIAVNPDDSFVQEDSNGAVRRGAIQTAGGRLTFAFADGTREEFGYAMSRNRIDFLRGNGQPETFYWQRINAPAPVGPGFGPAGVVDLRPRLISKEIVVNRRLKPATVEFQNSHDEEIWVLIADVRDDTASLRLKIPAGESRTVQLERDAGSTIVESWEIPLRTGDVTIEERKSPVPPEQLYNVSVYELFVQSVALDATRPGRQRIEDINYSPKSVGAFPVPAGEALQDEVLDVYEVAKAEKNPGTVDRINPADWNRRRPDNTDPIKRILRQQQRD